MHARVLISDFSPPEGAAVALVNCTVYTAYSCIGSAVINFSRCVGSARWPAAVLLTLVFN